MVDLDINGVDTYVGLIAKLMNSPLDLIHCLIDMA